ncbi:toxin secretion/phage lysis holin [Fusobacterium gonidiaformans 3-1-5R]|uniref:Toxin secretion/phage lysis holin n=1 Tax=Fusobacterium gonidiaformans 3-1-5R TaxID=469605 RepID=E5BET4_9FUSO|nr:phage holin family protein [Fusobacterium gonidiaformans]EFS20615.1 toxin secretion/phage lysis holin [Fusobacterium gonidiaformans 3-1-5R]
MIGLTKTYLALCWTGWIGFLVWLIGGFDLLAKVLLALMLLDFLTGLWVGYKQKILNSKRAYKGLQKKFLILVLLCGASLMHKLVPGIGFRSLVGLFYCATEMLSIIENCAKCGVPIPKKLKKALEQVRDK